MDQRWIRLPCSASLFTENLNNHSHGFERLLHRPIDTEVLHHLEDVGSADACSASRDGHDLSVLAPLADFSEHLDPVRLGHIQARYDHIRGLFLERVDSGQAVVGLTYVEALPLEQLAEKPAR